MKLGLIGHNIATSQAPDIHKRLGKLFGVSVSYELFDLKSKKESYFSDSVSYTHLTLPTNREV